MRRPASRARALSAAAVAATAAAACFSASALGQNLFTNPSFETGDFSGWTKTNGGSVRAADAEFVPRTGNFAIDTTASGVPGGQLTQTVPVTGGTLYEVGLWMSLLRRSGGSAGVSVTAGVGIDRDTNQGSATTTLNNRTPGYERLRTLVWIPAGQSTTTIRYRLPGGFESNTILAADDFYMTPWTGGAPAPAAEPIFVSGSSIAGGGIVGGASRPSVANDGRVAAVGRVDLNDNRLLIRAADGSYSAPPTPGLLLDYATLSPGGDALLLRGRPTSSSLTVIATMDGAGNIVEHAREGLGLPGGGSVNRMQDARVDDAGRVVFSAQPTSAQTSKGIYRSTTGAGITPIAVTGTSNAQGVIQSLSDFTLSSRGQVAFAAGVLPAGATGTKGFIYVNDGAANIVRVVDGDEAPGTGGQTFASLGAPQINDAGAVVFVGGLGTTSTSPRGIWVNDGTATHLLALTNTAAPGGGTYTRDFGIPVIGNGGHVAFPAVTSDGSGLFLARAGDAPVAIARAGDALPGGATFGAYNFSIGGTPIDTKVLAGGQVVFLARHDSNERGIYIGDGRETINVAAWGQTLEGKTIARLEIAPPRPFNVSSFVQPPVAANDLGQVAYTATFAEGGTGHYLFTPTLHWRSESSGDWSNRDNWTLGLAPAHVHPVVIDSPHNVNVVAPAGETHMDSLEVGAGNSLTLAGSDLTISDGATIAGTLAGRGTIAGDVTLAPTGAIALDLLDGEFDSLVVDGTLDLGGGDVFVFGHADLGEMFTLITADSITGAATWHLPGESTMQIVPLPGGGQNVQVTYVPEPGGAFVVLGAIAVLAARRRSHPPR